MNGVGSDAPVAKVAGSRSVPSPLAAVHLDLDGASHIYRLHGWDWAADIDAVYESGVSRALDIFAQFDIHATFFVIAEDLDDAVKAELVQEIVKHGHDVASHSLTHAPLVTLDTESKRREIVESRDRIRAAIGVEPAGFRAPDFSIDAASLRILAETGYEYDTSVVPGRTVPGLGFTPADRPSPLWVDEPLVELPLPGHRPLPFPFHPSYSLVLGTRYFDWGLARFRRTGAPLVLLFHLIDFADPLPRSMLSGWSQRLYTLSHIDGRRKSDACRRMLERVLRSYTLADTPALVAAARRQQRRHSP